jgi:hypothetical protein
MLGIITKHVQATFKRKQMKDFEYLKDEIDPPDALIVFIGLMSVLGSLGLTAFFYFYEVDLTDYNNIVRKKVQNGRRYRGYR